MRKLLRKVKRARYNVSFERRYKMKRSEWVLFKKKNMPEKVNRTRVTAQIV